MDDKYSDRNIINQFENPHYWREESTMLNNYWIQRDLPAEDFRSNMHSCQLRYLSKNLNDYNETELRFNY